MLDDLLLPGLYVLMCHKYRKWCQYHKLLSVFFSIIKGDVWTPDKTRLEGELD